MVYDVDEISVVTTQDGGHDVLVEWSVVVQQGNECTHATSDMTRFTFSSEQPPTIRKMKVLPGHFGLFMNRDENLLQPAREIAVSGTSAQQQCSPMAVASGTPTDSRSIRGTIPDINDCMMNELRMQIAWEQLKVPLADQPTDSALSGAATPRMEEKKEQFQTDTTAEPAFASEVFTSDVDSGKPIDFDHALEVWTASEDFSTSNEDFDGILGSLGIFF